MTHLSGYSRSEMIQKLQQMRSMYDLGKNTTALRYSLSLMCKPNYFFRNVDDGTVNSGSDIFAYVMHMGYENGWATNGPDACAKLIATPPY